MELLPYSAEPPSPPQHRAHHPSRSRFAVLAGLAGLVVVAAILLVTRRGGDGDEGETSDAGDDIVKNDDPLMSYLVEFSLRVSGGTVDDQQARCMATNIVDELGRDRLMEADVLGGTDSPLLVLTQDEAVTFMTAGFSCLDDAELVTFMAATWDPESWGGIPTETAPCLYEGWIDGWGRERSIEVFARFIDPARSPEMRSVLSEAEYEVWTDVLATCVAETPTTTTTTVAA